MRCQWQIQYTPKNRELILRTWNHRIRPINFKILPNRIFKNQDSYHKHGNHKQKHSLICSYNKKIQCLTILARTNQTPSSFAKKKFETRHSIGRFKSSINCAVHRILSLLKKKHKEKSWINRTTTTMKPLNQRAINLLEPIRQATMVRRSSPVVCPPTSSNVSTLFEISKSNITKSKRTFSKKFTRSNVDS